MKLIPFLLLIVITFVVIKIYNNKNPKRKINNKIFTLISGIILLSFLTGAIFSAFQPDTWCSLPHKSSSKQPSTLATSDDYFERGNYFYDIGSCKLAIDDYTKSINLNLNNTQSYNNRAYTFMRMHQYDKALNDLNKAIGLQPNYTNALMNRGDIYNYYYNLNRSLAMKDYEKVIALGKTKGNSVCGHMAMARYNHFLPAAFVNILLVHSIPGC